MDETYFYPEGSQPFISKQPLVDVPIEYLKLKLPQSSRLGVNILEKEYSQLQI